MPMVLATSRPVMAPAILKKAASITAFRREIEREPTEAAMALAASLVPLIKAKPRARIMITIRKIKSGTLDHYPVENIGDVLAPVGGYLHMPIDLTPFDHIGQVNTVTKELR